MATAARLTYRPHLDGLRGVAITLVLVQHFVGWPQGAGTVGVAVFFALSGYLITGLLLDEHERAGRVDLLAFYVRRAGRLAPGLLAMLAVTVPLLRLVGVAAGRPALGALSYSTNYGIITGWLHPGQNPYLQTWSLAIEEHFYLLWAPVLLWAVRRGGARLVLRAALVGAVACAAWRFDVAVGSGNPLWVAWGTLCRGDALLAGCAMAAARRLGFTPPRAVLPASLAALVTLVAVGPRTIGGPAVTLALALTACTVACVGLVAAIDVHDGWVRRILASRPLVAFGLLSYSLYLWHLPIMYLVAGRLPTVVTLALSFAVAATSYYCVERPARRAVRATLRSKENGTPALRAVIDHHYRTRRAARRPEPRRGLGPG